MTRHKHAHTGLVTPSLPQLLLTATLRLFAMLVSSVASTLQMWFRRPAVNATRPMPDALPEETSDTPQQETLDRALTRPTRQSTRSVETDAEHDDPTIIITPQATPAESFSGLSRESRLAQRGNSNFIVPLIPTEVGTQGGVRGLFRPAASSLHAQPHRSWIPAFAGMSGERARKTAPA